ncbi:MAG: DNA-binding protein [Methanonatronarchaeales archaeon]|nr:DNA-binding protein [Methanonatronarchaeales archaeon]
MGDEELDKLREERLKEMVEGQESEEKEASSAEAGAQRKAVLRQILTPEARERLSNLRVARPSFAESVEQQLVVLAAQGRVSGKIDDSQLKQILRNAQSGKRDVSIRRK